MDGYYDVHPLHDTCSHPPRHAPSTVTSAQVHCTRLDTTTSAAGDGRDEYSTSVKQDSQ